MVVHLPTDHQALFKTGGEQELFVCTVGKSWTSGTFGWVRGEPA